MAKRWRDPSGFRAEAAPVERGRPSRTQAGALLAALLLVAGTVAAASYFVEPERARTFDVFHGSLFLNDSVAPVAVDLASGRPTVRLIAANTQVSATSMADVAVVPVDDGTLLLNGKTGEFNMVDTTGFVIKNNNTGGVLLPSTQSTTSAFAVASGSSAYIVRTGSAGTSAYLVGQSTVVEANQGAKPKARAFRTLNQTASSAPGGAAAANGNLWLLLGSGATRAVTELTLPAGSAPGVQLRPHDHGTVTGPAAIATAGSTTGVDDTTVGVASAGRILLASDGSTKTRTVRFAAPASLEKILPASNAQGRLSYLLKAADGWSLLSVNADGSGLRGPTALPDLPAGDDLVAPATSEGALYTMSTGAGDIFRIDGGGRVTVLSRYPLAKSNGRVVETAGFADAYAIARGARVILNSPGHNDATVLFTDGTHRPMAIAKSQAVSVSAAGGAQALTNNRLATPPPPKTSTRTHTPPPKPSKPTTTVPAAIPIDCQTTSQQPHLPNITQAVPGSRSVSVTWSYPLLDPQDCQPSTYVVDVKLLAGPVSPSRSSFTVQGQTGVLIAGLYPSSRYEVRVQAYINAKDQPGVSAWRPFGTGPEGPSAAQNVTASVDATGAWTVAWNSCGTAADSCVPSTSWQIVPEFCDGIGLSDAPAPIDVAGDPTTSVQPSARIPSSESLLGRSLSFRVQGFGSTGQQGAISGSTGCLLSWRAPNPAAMTLNAAVPSTTALGQSAPVTASLNLGSTPATTAGGRGAAVTFTLTNGTTVQTSSPLTFDGTTSTLSTTFGSVLPGVPYTVTASVSPPGHPEAAATVGSVAVRTASAWPTPAATASCAPGLLTCALSVRITNVSSAGANGELFTLDPRSQLACGSVALPLTQSAFDPAATAIAATPAQLSGFFGPCTVTVGLIEAGAPANPYFGGVPSPLTTVPVDLGSATLANLVKSDVRVRWGSGSGSTVALTYVGSLTDSLLNQLTSGWTETLTAPDGTACGSDAEQPTSNGIGFAVDPTCVNQFGGSTANWTVTLGYRNAVDGSQGQALTWRLAGPVPGYQQCAPTGFGAAWGATIADGVSITSPDDPSLLQGCSGWSYELDDATQTACSTNRSGNAPPYTISVDCGTPPTVGWQVVVRWTDTAGNAQNQTISVTGDPPTS